MPSQPLAPHVCAEKPPIPFELVDTDNDTRSPIEVYCTLAHGHPGNHEIDHQFFEHKGGTEIKPREVHWR
jgi:hypothetical protein